MRAVRILAVADELRTKDSEAEAMWRHIEPERLHQVADGAPLLDSEVEHLVFCDVCQELLLTFSKLLQTVATQQKEAA